MRGVFVTGTDTGIGKTVTSSLVLAALRESGPVGYWKPVQTGIESDDDTAEVARLARASAEEICSEGIRLPRPLSPHLSARLAGRSIRIAQLLRMADRTLERNRYWIVEGAGGLLVPLNGRELMADLIKGLHLQALITARSGLGTINHTLLTISEMRRRAIPIAGAILVGKPNRENRAAIEEFGRVRVLAEVPTLKPMHPDTVCPLAGRLASKLRCLVDNAWARDPPRLAEP